MDQDIPPPPHRPDKGKGRVANDQPTESTPLLASGSLSSSRDASLEYTAPGRRLRSRLLSVFLVTLSLCVLLFVLLAIAAYSWHSRASDTRPEDIIQRALVVRGPDRVDVLGAGEDGVQLMVYGRIGLDAGAVVGVKTGEEDTILGDLWKSLGRWSIRQIDRVTVTTSTIRISPRSSPNTTLATISTPPIEVLLTADPPPRSLAWLTPIQIPVSIQPTKDAAALVHFVRESWKNGFVSVQSSVGHAVVRGGGLQDGGWRSRFVVKHDDIRPVINMKIPSLPGLPPPGTKPFPGFSDLVTLESFEVVSANGTIAIDANATAVSPLPMDLEFNAPPLPFTIALPSPDGRFVIPLAAVRSLPFALTRPNISLAVVGSVLPIPRSASGALSTFLGQYISGRDSDIRVLTPLLPSLVLDAKFPAPRPPPQILRNVTITDMRIKPVGTSMVASGIVHAVIVLPHGINVGVNASRVFPDVLVFDGPVPDNPETNVSGRHWHDPLPSRPSHDPPPSRPLPDPLPPRAFAHILPEDWLDAECTAVRSLPGDGTTIAVSAEIDEVPLEVLPGREREFSNFVSKVIFGTQGALAGVQGVAAVAVRVDGLPFANGRDGEMELSGLPFQGSVRIGKKSTIIGHL